MGLVCVSFQALEKTYLPIVASTMARLLSETTNLYCFEKPHILKNVLNKDRFSFTVSEVASFIFYRPLDPLLVHSIV